jgi:hypothetical protein
MRCLELPTKPCMLQSKAGKINSIFLILYPLCRTSYDGLGLGNDGRHRPF